MPNASSRATAPRARLRAVLFVASAALTLGCGSDGPTDPKATSTLLAYTSDRNDYIGQGESHRYTLADGTWSARVGTYGAGGTGRVNHVAVVFNGRDNAWWTLDVQAPDGQTLGVGTYARATRWPFQDATDAGLDFSGSGRGCNTSTGRFTITELVPGVGGTIDRLRVTFEQHCEGVSDALRGEVAIVANPWR